MYDLLFLNRNQIDIIKYDNCIKSAVNSRIYACSWYLDIVADNWGVLVLDDYEAVMPLPWRQKYFIKYVYPPAWTQQLGVFSKHKIDADLIKEFIWSIPKKFKKITIQFNSGNDVSFVKTTKRINYILSLDKNFEYLLNKYKKSRKHSIDQGKKNELIIKKCLFSELLKIAHEYYLHLKIDGIDYKTLELLAEFIKKNDKGFLLGVYNKQEKLIGGAFFLKDAYRISYLFSVVTSEGRQLQATSILINSVLEKNSNSNYIFDFEGSMISSIASFFNSFGAQKETYFLYQKLFLLF